MSDRGEILADFKSCTGIADDGEAILHLEAANWDLLNAVSKVIPNDSQKLPSEIKDRSLVEDPKPLNQGIRGKSVKNSTEKDKKVYVHLDSDAGSSKVKRIRFVITNDHANSDLSVCKFVLPEHETVRTLKELVRSKYDVPPCRQLLVGWPGTEPADTDEIGNLNLPDIMNLSLFTIVEADKPSAETSSDAEELVYTLIIRDEILDKVYKVTYNGKKQIVDVKHGIFSLTDIPYSQQVWTGWPENTNDNTTLATAGISYPVHHLSVKTSTDAVVNNNKKAKRSVSRSNSDESMDDSSPVELEDEGEEEDDDDDEEEEEGEHDNEDDDEEDEHDDNDDMHSIEDDITFESDFPTTNNYQPLLPEQFESESVASFCFSYQFENRYGTAHPQFFVGTFDEALKESCFRSARERKLLAVYLHHDKSVLTNVFCTQLLCFDSVIQYLTNNFVLWGWDLTSNSNREHLLRIVTEKLGPLASGVIRSTRLDKMPILVIITRVRGNTEILTTITGNVTLNELISSLIQAVDIFTEQRSVEILEEDDRERRESIKVEQDEAYRLSLEHDRAKEEAKRKQEELEKAERDQLLNAKRQEEEEKKAARQALESQLPPEPEFENESVTKIRIRLPTNVMLERKFLVSEKLQVLLNYLMVNDFHTDDYKLCTAFPRRDLTVCNPDATLKELKLFPQETLVIEHR